MNTEYRREQVTAVGVQSHKLDLTLREAMGSYLFFAFFTDQFTVIQDIYKHNIHSVQMLR